VHTGFLNLYKPVDWTSHDCVAKVRRLLKLKKVGHGGTLDPAACGVLPIALGRATRLLQFLPEDKAYRAVIRFGVVTDTDDLEGTELLAQPVPDLNEAVAIAPRSQFVGTITQIPPRYSAIQVEGKRLYDLARKGKEVEVPQRTVTVHQITPVQWQPGAFPELTVDIACGAGTYIRSIARDWGAALGTGATLAGLTRTRSSGFTLDTSLTLEQVETALTTQTFTAIAPAVMLRHLPAIVLPTALARRWQHGQKIGYDGFAEPPVLEQPYSVWDDSNTFLGITEVAIAPDTSEIRLLPKVVFTLPAP